MQLPIKRVYMPLVKRAIALLIGVFLLVVVSKGIAVSMRLMSATGLTPGVILRLLFNTSAPLAAQENRTNVLLLGVGGGTHTGADLTDTMLLLSFHGEQKSLAMISIPRDIWSDTLKDKINSAYHYGEAKQKGGGMILSKAILSDVVGLPIHYAMVIDFSGFEEVIDLVGGVTINVPVVFTDTEFPIPGKELDECNGDLEYRCRYEAVHFDAGVQNMDGERALMYVRSRQSVGEEGSDFARGKRQQEVVAALKQKLTTPTIWLSPSRATQFISAFQRSTETDMKVSELATVMKLFATIPENRVARISIEDELIAPPLIWYGRYVLVPKESFEALHAFIQSQLDL